ncbi:MAG: creatininase family protein [Acidobacteriia bacterium]|nr:creatininase family protein [Terriglobia bacterium]
MRGVVTSLLITAAWAQAQSSVEFGMMTWPEVKKALQSGKTTALVYNGGTEQRGPQNVNGGHTLIAREVSRRIAEKLGNAIVAPVLPFSPNNASAKLPGTIGITPALFAAINEQVAEQLIITGFKSVVLMGDHGGGQKELGDVARKLDEKYSSKGIHVVFCDGVYVGTKEHPGAQADFEQWLADNGYPSGGHAGVSDTSEMLYLGGDRGWVRKDLIKTAVGDPVLKPGERRDANAPRIDNGITGDARRSTAELGKRFIDMKVDYGVRQIRELLSTGGAAPRF